MRAAHRHHSRRVRHAVPIEDEVRGARADIDRQDTVLTLLQSVFRETVSGLQSVATLALVLVIALVLATRAVERREYVLEQ